MNNDKEEDEKWCEENGYIHPEDLPGYSFTEPRVNGLSDIIIKVWIYFFGRNK